MRLFLFFLPVVLLLSSCDEDSFSTTVQIPFPEHEPLPVLTADVRSGDTSIFARVALSRGILDDPTVTDKEASLQLYRDGELLLESRTPLVSTDGRNLEFPLPQPLSPAAAEYRFVATVDGFDPVEATQQMPAPFDYELISYEPEGAIDSDGFRVDELTIELTDNAATEDYYGIRVITQPGEALNCYTTWTPDTGEREVCDTFFNQAVYDLYLDSQDPLLKDAAGYGLVLPDDTFSGETYRIRLLADNYNRTPLRLEVFRLTEDAYRYGLSRWAYDDANGNPFAEPVNIHTNVSGGYGFFIMANRQVEDL